MEILNEIESKKIFEELSKKSNEFLSDLNLELDTNSITHNWESFRINMRNYIKEGIDVNFLNHPCIRHTMFCDDNGIANSETQYLGSELLKKITEYGFSLKNLSIDDFSISSNTVHHLTHLEHHKRNTKSTTPIESVLEWGGGYGNLCKLFIETNKNIKTYTLIDIPEFAVLQYIYLSSYFGKDKVKIVKRTEDLIEGINIIPLNCLNDVDVKKHDMFVSTWALTESSFDSQDIAINKGFLDYDKILLAYHQCGTHIPFMNESTRIRNLVKERGTSEINIDFISGINYYAIK